MPVALAPEPGGVQHVGEVSLAAEAFGIHPGMRLGEALSRCRCLTLVPPHPSGVADAWERLPVRLESVGARKAKLPERAASERRLWPALGRAPDELVGLLEHRPVDPLDQRLSDRADRPELDRV